MAGGADRAMLAFLTSFEQVRADLPRYQATLRSVGIPAMIAWGEHDEILLAAEQAPRLAALLDVPLERVHMLPEGAHYIQEENAPVLAELVDAFMEQEL
jgi:pimeloyl-ACP methyl ester carboxylesterase